MMANLHFSSKLVGRSGVRMRSGVNSRVKSMAAGSKKLVLGALLLAGAVFSVNGQGTHCGAAAADWLRLRTAVSTISSGQTINIHTRSSGVTEVVTGVGIDYHLVLCDQEDFINSTGTVITIPNSKTITIKSANTTDIITLHTPTGTARHFSGGNASSNFIIEDLILDGDNIAGGIQTTFGITTATLTITNSTIKNCVISGSSGGSISSGGPLTVTNSTIKNCVASSSGGGIYANNELTLKGEVIVSNNTVSGSSSSGGGIYKSTAGNFNTGDLTRLDVTDNTVISGSGGGIYIAAVVSFTPENNVTISRNKAKDGGGIWTDSHLTMSGGLISGNTASEYGGGICIVGSGITISGGKIQGNYAGISGGGIYGYSGVTISEASALVPTIIGGDGPFPSGATAGVDANVGNKAAGTTATSGGGGIYINSGTSTTLVGANVKIKNNEAVNHGGGIYVSSGLAKITGAIIISNKAISSSSNGGGIYTSGNLTMSDGLISGNTAPIFGGGIYNSNSGTTISGGKIQGNYAGTSGGGIYSVHSIGISETSALVPTIIGGDGVFSGTTAGVDANVGNKAAGSGASDGGGGVYITTNGTLTVDANVKIKNNETVNHGGGIYTTRTTNISSAIISNNKATGSSSNGGGIYSSGTTTSITLSATSVANNTTGNHGGGIYCTSGTAGMTLSAASITNNTAGNHGGGIYFVPGFPYTLSLGNSSITNNKAGWDGTAVTGDREGGGIFMENVTRLTASAGVTFSGNKTLKPYWLAPADGTYCGASGTQAITYATTTQPALKNPPTTFSAPPAGNYPFEYAYNNYDVNWVGTRDNNQIIDTVCFSDSVTLSVKVVNGGQNPTYKWILNRVEIVGSNDSIFKYKSSGRDTIQCKVYPDTACGNEVYSQTMVIYRLPKPVLNQPSSTEVCVGKETESVTFSGTYQYVKWEVTTGNGTAIGMPANSGTGNIPAFTTTNSGEITITATPVSGECEGDPKTFTITVTPKVKPKATIRIK